MSSVALPSVYRQFTKNFAFSIGLVNFERMQTSIDNFRAATGGNTTTDSVKYLANATLVFQDGSIETLGDSKIKRAMTEFYDFVAREITTSVDTNDTSTDNTTSSSTSSAVTEEVQGIKAYVEELSIPDANTFMTVLLIVSCVMAAIICVILLIKVVLEAWALFGKLPAGLTGFRKHYWVTMSRLLTQLIMLLYGTWVLYCMYQFITGDSWAAKLLAGLTLALFTGVLAFFAYKVTSTAKKLKELNGDASQLYENKDLWIKYKLFYDNYKKSYWWLFIPVICYMFAKGVVMAVGDTHGMAQTIAQFVVEAIMLAILVWNRPFERKSGNVLNISIQVVRLLSVICIFVFVDELGIEETAQTVVGLVLVVIQSVLTGILAILIIWNAVVAIFKENPHRKRRKEMGKSCFHFFKCYLEMFENANIPFQRKCATSILSRLSMHATPFCSTARSRTRTRTPFPWPRQNSTSRRPATSRLCTTPHHQDSWRMVAHRPHHMPALTHRPLLHQVAVAMTSGSAVGTAPHTMATVTDTN